MSWSPPFPNRSRIYPEIEKLAREQSIDRIEIEAGQRLHWNENVTWEILYPGDHDPPTGLADDRCLVMKIRAGRWKILCTSDIGFQIEQRLAREGWNLNSDIWIRGQHSATRSGLGAFLSGVSPRVIISTNSNFPSSERLTPEWLREIRKAGITLLTLDKIGSAQIVVNEDELRIRPFLGEGVIAIQK